MWWSSAPSLPYCLHGTDRFLERELRLGSSLSSEFLLVKGGEGRTCFFGPLDLMPSGSSIFSFSFLFFLCLLVRVCRGEPGDDDWGVASSSSPLLRPTSKQPTSLLVEEDTSSSSTSSSSSSSSSSDSLAFSLCTPSTTATGTLHSSFHQLPMTPQRRRAMLSRLVDTSNSGSTIMISLLLYFFDLSHSSSPGNREPSPSPACKGGLGQRCPPSAGRPVVVDV